MEKTVLITAVALLGIVAVVGIDVFYGVYAELSFDKQSPYPVYMMGEEVLVKYSFKNHVLASEEIIDPGIQVSCSYNVEKERRDCRRWRRCIRYSQDGTCKEWETVEYQCDGCECIDWYTHKVYEEESVTIYSSPSGERMKVGPLETHTKIWTFPAQLQQNIYARCTVTVLNCPAEKCSSGFSISQKR
jgi:hypothetical protein